MGKISDIPYVMEKIWFVFNAGEVLGPFSTEEISKGIDRSKWQSDALIWWKGQNEWIPISNWKQQLPLILDARNRKTGSMWYIEKQGQKFGPISKIDLIQFLKSSPGVDDIHLWSEHSSEWRPVYSYPEVVKELGFYLRSSPRAQIIGTVSIHGYPNPFKLEMIGEGGFGILGGSQLTRGELHKVTLASPLLVNPVRVDASVRFISSKGEVGFKFENITAESEAIIVDYVKQYKDTVDNETHPGKMNGQWYVNREGLQHGPISRAELITLLQWIENRSSVNLWTTGMNQWSNVFEFNEILDELGITRRASKRAPILGQIFLNQGKAEGSLAAVSVSETGLGIKLTESSLTLGSTLDATLVATAFDQKIPFKAQVMYVEDNGFGGLRFLELKPQDQRLLQQYVERFATQDSSNRKAAA